MAIKDVPSHPVEAAAEEAQQPQKGVLGTIKEALGLGVGGAGGGAASESKTVEAEVKERVEAEAPGTPGGASPVCPPSKARDPALKLAVGAQCVWGWMGHAGCWGGCCWAAGPCAAGCQTAVWRQPCINTY